MGGGREVWGFSEGAEGGQREAGGMGGVFEWGFCGGGSKKIPREAPKNCPRKFLVKGGGGK